MISYNVVFRNKSDKSETSIRLYSHYTCVFGEDSGEGKTKFLSFVSDMTRTDNIEILIESPFDEEVGFAIIDGDSIETALLVSSKRFVYMVDEAFVLSSKWVKQFNKSEHLFIVISRGFPFKADAPICGLYRLVEDNGCFDFVSMPELPLAKDFTRAYDNIVAEGDLETSFLEKYIDGVVNSNGRDNIEKRLRNLSGSCLVFADLGNIAKEYKVLLKRCKDNKKIVFYDYVCFEQLLRESRLVQENKITDGDTTFVDVLTLERLYESLLEQETKGTFLEYRHGVSELPSAYTDNFDALLDSNIGRNLKEYIINLIG